MKRLCMALGALALMLAPLTAAAQDKLVVSVWGGSWRDTVDAVIAKKFTAQTGVPVEYVTGGTIDRLN
ncbi:MAG TPA: ABC transporter substrate-binding protein, partial [Xanthobacteraceae bacterium]|nr:ABC transporter substrate-binding protein [Xanthobacteraceae bacterium]